VVSISAELAIPALASLAILDSANIDATDTVSLSAVVAV
jgi:hypothetical protein